MNPTQITEVILAWMAVTSVLSLVNKYGIATRWPRAGAFLSSICAVSPGDIVKVAEQIALLFAPAAVLPNVLAASRLAAARGVRAQIPLLPSTEIAAIAPAAPASPEPAPPASVDVIVEDAKDTKDKTPTQP